ncbi:hypothetical protein [Alteromonas oceanisediminis]|uniref:hypothetical protein n=1 Tax=Alteromonas oceanisediminis TaxID=2836180 RepID=UPI001BDAD91D|nr:hypothetical protein [Alteromonas oceanisediminis]MBT0587966.1 hypothetical protein [Alteromonas oceanisediminis]
MYTAVVIGIGAIILANSGYDLYQALTIDQTVDDIANQDISIMSSWYIAGIIYGAVCYYGREGLEKVTGGVIGATCTLMTGYVALDTVTEAYLEPNQKMTDCIKQGDAFEQSNCISDFTEEEFPNKS